MTRQQLQQDINGMKTRPDWVYLSSSKTSE